MFAPPVVVTDEEASDRAVALAAALDSEVLACAGDGWRRLTEHSLVLLLSAGRVSLASPQQPKIHPVSVDFAEPGLLRRLLEPGARRQDLPRATGVAEHRDLVVIDLTAGWGTDAAVLAALGARVTLIERHPVVAALLADGLARAQSHPDATVRAIGERMHLLAGDACALLNTLSTDQPFVVMMDPMFPARTKSAAVRKEMQFFHMLVGPDQDSAALLETALASAASRVVVKRPRKAPVVGDRQPTRQLPGKVTRFDIYALRALR